jgi:hypothetical protein
MDWMLLGLGTQSQISGLIWDGVPNHGIDYTFLLGLGGPSQILGHFRD